MTRFRLLKGVLIVLAAIVAIGLAGGFAVQLYGGHRLSAAKTRYEKAVGPLDLASLDRPSVPDADNAVTWLGPGIGAVVLLDRDRATVADLAAKPAGSWTDAQVATLAAILERNGPAFALLDRARGMRRSNWAIEYRKGSDAKLPNLLAALNAAKLLRARAKLALRDGDRETALRSVETLGALSRSLEAEPSMIVLLVGSAVERLQLDAARDLLASPGIDDDGLGRIDASLGDADLVAALKRSMRRDAASVVHDILAADLVGRLPRIVPASLARGLNDLLAASLLDVNAATYRNAGAPVTAPLGSDAPRPSGWWARLVAASTPNLRSAEARMLSTSSARDLARIAVDLRRAAAQDGSYPIALPAVAQVPERDPLSGQPWIYAVRPDGAAEVRSATTKEILHSIFVVGAPASDALSDWVLPPPPAGAPRAASSRPLH